MVLLTRMGSTGIRGTHRAQLVQLLEVPLVDVTRNVLAIEARQVEVGRILVAVADGAALAPVLAACSATLALLIGAAAACLACHDHGADHVLKLLVDHAVGANAGRNLVVIPAVSH